MSRRRTKKQKAKKAKRAPKVIRGVKRADAVPDVRRGIARTDSVTPVKIQSSGQGGVVATANVTRSGLLKYKLSDGTSWIEYRPPEEVFSADSLASMRGAPVTLGHPIDPKTGAATLVTPDNFKALSHGASSGDPEREGDWAVLDLACNTPPSIRSVVNRERTDCSAGYVMDLVVGEGFTPEGERYDAKQTNIRYNHFSLEPPGAGRSGPGGGLRLDSNLVQLEHAHSAIRADRRDPNMEYEWINGVRYEVGSADHSAAVTKRSQDQAKRDADAVALQARCDAAEARVKEVEASVPKLVAERAALENKAREYGVPAAEIRADMSAHELRVKTLSIAASKTPLEGKDETYVTAMFDVVTAKPPSREAVGEMHRGVRGDATQPAPASGPEAAPGASTLVTAREKRIATLNGASNPAQA